MSNPDTALRLNMKHHGIPVLDCGYVKLVDHWGSDEAVIEAARMSTGKGFNGWDKDKKLLTYLYDHKHMTPFEMSGVVIEVKAPIFVFREWHRHRTQSYNEMSARYIPLPNESYSPDVARIWDPMQRSTTNKQAASVGEHPADINDAHWFIDELATHYALTQEIYEQALERGIPKELARIILPVARYSRMRASSNLRNWLGFLTLRMDLAAQYEIRVYAQAVGQIIAELFPETWSLFDNPLV